MITIGKQKVFYICDRKQCKRCNEECNHTSKKSHSINFKEKDIDPNKFRITAYGDYWEVMGETE